MAQLVDFHASSIRVTINDGIAHLEGHLPSPVALQTVLQGAEAVPGVTAVESEIVVT